MSRQRPLSSFSYVGPHRYFLTCCTANRRRLFDDPQVVAMTRQQFERTATIEGFVILAFCFMPDHGHLLVEGITASADFRRFVKLARQRSGSMFARRRGTTLWQDGCYERVLRTDEASIDVVKYIIGNPVRAGLVRTPREYPHLGSQRWTLDELVASVK